MYTSHSWFWLIIFNTNLNKGLGTCTDKNLKKKNKKIKKLRNTSDTSQLYYAIEIPGTVKMLYKYEMLCFWSHSSIFLFANYDLCMGMYLVDCRYKEQKHKGKYPLDGIYVLDIGDNIMAHLDSRWV